MNGIEDEMGWEGVGSSDAICGGLKALSASAFLPPPHLSDSNDTLKGKSFTLTPEIRRISHALRRHCTGCLPVVVPPVHSPDRPSFKVKVELSGWRSLLHNS